MDAEILVLFMVYGIVLPALLLVVANCFVTVVAVVYNIYATIARKRGVRIKKINIKEIWE